MELPVVKNPQCAGWGRLFVFGALFCLLISPARGAKAGIWSPQGIVPALSDGGEFLTSSPWDPTVTLRQTVNGVELVGAQVTQLTEIQSPPALTEIIWSDHDRSLIINSSDGGLVGTWESHYYKINADKTFTHTNLRTALSSFAKSIPICSNQETPNIFTIGWDIKTGYLITVLQSPNHSSCKDMEELHSFEINTNILN